MAKKKVTTILLPRKDAKGVVHEAPHLANELAWRNQTAVDVVPAKRLPPADLFGGTSQTSAKPGHAQ